MAASRTQWCRYGCQRDYWESFGRNGLQQLLQYPSNWNKGARIGIKLRKTHSNKSGYKNINAASTMMAVLEQWRLKVLSEFFPGMKQNAAFDM